MTMVPGSVLAERFYVHSVAGTGGMSTVYRAEDRQTGEIVALKIMSGDGKDNARFHQEARIVAELSHPSIVRYVAHGTTSSGQSYLAMEWLDGESLSEHLRRRRPSVAEVVTLVRTVGEALASAHAKNIIHRDLKPSNIFLVGEGTDRPKLLDFGIARITNLTRAATRTGMMLGTPGYMSPEQARGDRSLDARADIFALGCVLFEGLTGRPAFAGEHPMALLAKILLQESPRPSQFEKRVPEALDQLVVQMLAKDPAERPADLATVLEALRAIDLEDEEEHAASLPASLGRSEQRLLSVVLAGDDRKLDTNPTLDGGPQKKASTDERPTPPAGHRHWKGLRASSLDVVRASEQLAELRATIEPFGGRLEMLADGSLVWILMGTGVATDQAAQAARCALALRKALPLAPMAIATGRGEVHAQWSMGEVIDRAARLLFTLTPARPPEEGAVRGVRIDEVTAGLLDTRFDVGGNEEGLALRGERELTEMTRTLLGRPTQCVGRDRELAALDAFYRECVDEPRARPVLVTAPPGTGKSRLRYELIRRFASLTDGPALWIARGDPLRAGSPFGLLAPALRRAAAILDGEPLVVQQQKLRARIARTVRPERRAFVTTFVAELAGVPFPDGSHPELQGARREPMVMGDHMRQAFTEWLAAETAERPLVLVLEDLHWGDLPTVKMIDHVLRYLAESPLLVLALARPEVHDVFPGLWGERSLEEIRLGPLTRKAAERLVRQVLGDSVPDATVERLVQQADGNALFLEELIRAARESSSDETLPDTVIAMVQARLERLEPEARRVLRAAAVFGELFWKGGVEALLSGEDQAQISDWLNELSKRELVTVRADRKFPGEIEFTFRHALVREAAYATLTDADRVLGHRLAAEWLQGKGELDAMTLAEHFERGHEPGRAVAFYRRAALQAVEGNDLEAALLRCQRGLDCGAEGELRGQLRLVEMEAHGWRGEWSQADQSGSEAVRCLERSSPDWFMAMALNCEAASKLGNADRLEVLGEDLRDYAGDGAMIPEQAVAMARCAAQLYLQGRTKLADDLVERLRGVAATLADRPHAFGWVADAFAVRALYTGDLGGYLTAKQDVVAAFGRAGQRRTEVIQRVRLGYACLEIGDYQRACRELKSALAEAEQLGIHQAVALAKHNLGLALSRIGEHVEAEKLESEAVAIFRAQGDQRLERASRIYLGEIYLAAGNLGAAARHMEYVEQSTPEKNPVRAYALGQLARVRVLEGRAPEALVLAEEAFALYEALGGIDEGESVLRLALAEAQEALGRHDEAKQTLAEARRRLLERADRIVDPELRAMFLERVPENRATLGLPPDASSARN